MEAGSNFIPPAPLVTPVLFLVFNRPAVTDKVFDAIRRAKPSRLFVAADGPRPGRPGEEELCAQVRKIATSVDWDCEVQTRFLDNNLGCQKAVSSAITWFFEQVEEGIILEDDCLPCQSFFWFCQDLLGRYRNDCHIFSISGNNFQKGRPRTDFSYYFSIYNHIWGWASYRRAWKHFDFDMTTWPVIKEGNWLLDLLNDKSAVKYWEKIFQDTWDKKINSWGYRWTFTCWAYSGLCILPNKNLVENIGFGLDATNTKSNDNYYVIKSNNIAFPLKHPPFIIRDTISDRFTQNNHFTIPLLQRIKNKLKSLSYGKS
ncbi:MAG: glycosyltransferase family 2 protein [Deltaproteobacteria bacterium]|nr:glycosyltransferase family 2 protein [Deltaproteobacteria bacterium]